jgi:AcrR family transcriptional regulator
MEATTETRVPQKLTGKGQATRTRILEHAAELIYTKGVHATNNEQLRRAAGISGSQLNHYFPTKESLVLAVIEWQAERVLTFHRSERFTHFDSLDSLREWTDHYIAYEHSYQEGCSLGSLASEIIKTDLDVRTQLANAFEQWTDIFRDGLERMQRLGHINADADPTRLAHLLLSAFQGGMLLAQIARDITPLKNALQAATDYVQTFTMPPQPAHAKTDSHPVPTSVPAERGAVGSHREARSKLRNRTVRP